MRYVGGKVRQAKAILGVILDRRGERTRYLEPFVGGAAVLAAVAPHFEHVRAGDIVPDLVLFWEQVQRAWIPPATLLKEDYEQLLHQPPSAERAWAGFAASYNGKWWGGYGPQAAGRDYLAESQRSTLNKVATFKHAQFRHRSYETWPVDADDVVYCDPPYEHDTKNHHRGRTTPEASGDTRYGAAISFDYECFWQTMTRWAQLGALVLVSEYTAPPGWKSVLTQARVETMNHRAKTSGARTEHLWIYSPETAETVESETVNVHA